MGEGVECSGESRREGEIGVNEVEESISRVVEGFDATVEVRLQDGGVVRKSGGGNGEEGEEDGEHLKISRVFVGREGQRSK